MSDNSNFIHNDKDNAIVYSERKRILFLGLPWTFTKYIITPEYITIRQGLFNRVEDDCYMYKAVSYTHLDVYKRQICFFRSCPQAPSISLPISLLIVTFIPFFSSLFLNAFMTFAFDWT